MEGLFLLALFYVCFTYVGHPLVLYGLASIWPRPWKRRDEPLSVTVVVAAHNEEKVIAAKLQNLLSQDYSGDCDIVIANDGSTDRTAEIAGSITGPCPVRLFNFVTNRGKSAMQNDIVPKLDSDIVVFSDATSMWPQDTLRRILESFADPEVGCVGVNLQFVNKPQGAIGRGQNAYWRYEAFLRHCGALFRTNVVVSGTCYAMRTELFRPIPANISEDLANPLAVVASHRRVVFDPEITVLDEGNVSHRGEARMRVRVALQNVTAAFSYMHLLNPKYGFAAYQLLAHKYFRVFCWVPLLAALILNLFLLGTLTYAAVFGFQISFYSIAALGWSLEKRKSSAGLLFAPYYFCMLNFAYLPASLLYLLGHRKPTWKTDRRSRA